VGVSVEVTTAVAVGVIGFVTVGVGAAVTVGVIVTVGVTVIVTVGVIVAVAVTEALATLVVGTVEEAVGVGETAAKEAVGVGELFSACAGYCGATVTPTRSKIKPETNQGEVSNTFNLSQNRIKTLSNNLNQIYNKEGRFPAARDITTELAFFKLLFPKHTS
jgi:hypothetical protein